MRTFSSLLSALALLLLSSGALFTSALNCTADEDCLPLSLRCLPDPHGSPCVLDYGFNTTGHCSCQAQSCAAVDIPAAIPGAKQWLVVGDSISMGYIQHAQQALGSSWQLVHGGSASTNDDNAYWGSRCIKDWLGPAPSRWDVVSYNAGRE